MHQHWSLPNLIIYGLITSLVFFCFTTIMHYTSTPYAAVKDVVTEPLTSKVLSQISVCQRGVCNQQQRLKTLQEGCKKYPEIQDLYDPDNRRTYFRLLVDDHHKILYCALPKAASTTFYNMFYFAVTGKELPYEHCKSCWEKEGLIWLHNISQKEERDRRLKEYYKILVVRHPLDRFISCWNGKFTRPYLHGTWLKNGPKMIELFRKVPEGSRLDDEIQKGATLNEFASYLNFKEQKGEPYEHNEHWNAHYRLCHPCSIDYDLIVKVETLQLDSKAVLDHLHLNASEFPLINARRTSENETLLLQKSLIELRNLSTENLEVVKQFYQKDMDLFGYHWNQDTFVGRCGGACEKDDSSCC